MSKTLEELIRTGRIPREVLDKMARTEAGLLTLGLGAMTYARSHDKSMNSVFPEKVYLGKLDDYQAGKLGFEPPYVKSDVIIRKAIDLLDAIALGEALR